jgi:hypothetical protein
MMSEQSEGLRTEIITFPVPVKIGGAEFTSVTMREPIVEDELAAAGGSNQENEVRLVARLCGLAYADVAKMRSAQYRLLQGRLINFLSSPWAKSAASS